MRLGDTYVPHGCSKCIPHVGSISSGSSSVYVNGRKASRVGDSVSCGGVHLTGSPNVFIGGREDTQGDTECMLTSVEQKKSFVGV